MTTRSELVCELQVGCPDIDTQGMGVGFSSGWSYSLCTSNHRPTIIFEIPTPITYLLDNQPAHHGTSASDSHHRKSGIGFHQSWATVHPWIQYYQAGCPENRLWVLASQIVGL